MNDETRDDSPDVPDKLRAGRLVFGAILADGDLSLVECIDHDRFDDNELDMALSTGVTSVSADLVPSVVDAEEEKSKAPPIPTGDDLERITSFDHVADIVNEAQTYYLLVNTDGHQWRRIKNTVPARFDPEAEIGDSAVGKYLISATLVEEATDRIANLPSSVAGEDIEIIDWGN